jgi:hypothetical protein
MVIGQFGLFDSTLRGSLPIRGIGLFDSTLRGNWPIRRIGLFGLTDRLNMVGDLEYSPDIVLNRECRIHPYPAFTRCMNYATIHILIGASPDL